ncbi:MAG: M15 family metallopeptidase [Sandaracinaceae bacterium]|nr:M15 family metallopeptidase [Sandaracinaceae bacterium]
MLRLRALLATLLVLSLVPACAPVSGRGEEGSDGELGYSETDDGLALTAGSVEEAMRTRCSTASVRGLALQLVGELNAMRPGRMERIDGIDNVDLNSAVIPYLQAPAAQALRRAAARRGSSTMTINSALRTLPQQYLLYSWYASGRCGIGLAARPGRSNHETGTAIDIDGYSSWRSALQSESYRWFGSSDSVHFDFVGSGTESLSSLSVLAFQRLWNRNHPTDRLSEDGSYGPQTEARLRMAPAAGFAIGPEGDAPAADDPAASTTSIGVSWSRGASGAYAISATAPASVVRVEYWVDGRNRISTVQRAASDTFATSYTFSSAVTERLFEARGFDASGAQIARGIGLIDTVSGTAVFIRQTGAAEYEIGLERAPTGVASIEVDADAFALTDATSGAARSSRLAVRSRFTLLGERQFSIRTYNADGTLRGTLRRTFTLE